MELLMCKPVAHADGHSQKTSALDRKAVAGKDPANRAEPEFLNSYAEASQSSGAKRRPLPLETPQRQGDQDKKIDFNRNEEPLADVPAAATPMAAPEKTNERQRQVGKKSTSSRHPKATAVARMMTVEDVAAYLSVSVSKIWRLCGKGVFPKSKRIGGSTRWDRSDIDHYLDQLSPTAHADR